MTEIELQNVGERERDRQAQFGTRICCCASSGCLSSGAQSLIEALRQHAERAPVAGGVEIVPTGCMGPCSSGPLVRVEQPGQNPRLYHSLSSEQAGLIVQGQLPREQELNLSQPFFQRQHKIVLENMGLVDPEKIEDYLAREGYKGLVRALHDFDPATLCEFISSSGLRGRGGAGYQTGLKWNLVRKAINPTRYIIANGDEGDPGAFMDRAVMEGDPHRILEGMIIAAWAIGAKHGYIYVRGEYPNAIRRLGQAIKSANHLGLLGRNILGTALEFHVEIRIGAGAFVCGEETALIASIEGMRGTPRPRPPYPAESGLFGCPTLINNVETFATIPAILRMGASTYAAIGTRTSTGTKVFALSGSITNTGLIEVPMGITLREIVYEIGGGIPGGKKFKAVQTGGPSGGCIPEEYLDLPVDYETLQRAGSIMGSGGMIVMDETSSMVDVARFFVGFCRDESCGKCIPCRAGTIQMHRLLDRIETKQGTKADLELLEDLCDVVKHTSLCGLGQSAPNPVLSTLRYFRHEYLTRLGLRHTPESSQHETTQPDTTDLGNRKKAE